jgi:DNA-binding response OmpR family regulator
VIARRALVVDDDDDIRLLVGDVLQRGGFEVDEAANGRLALRALTSGGVLPDVVVLDVQMPELDGWETLAAIRRDDRTSDVRVIMCTVRAQPADAARAWQLGCDGYLSKPFSISELRAEVIAVCERTESERLEHRAERVAALGAHVQ